MAEVGSYYISIMPSLKGFTKDVDKSLGDAGVSGGKSFISKFADAIGGGAAMVAKALAGATVATGTAFAAISKASLDAYADYEQLTGGVEKLFGSSSDTLMRYANDAYRTMGISANSYMEQSTSFAAALVSDLGGDTDKAVESVQVAMTSMADNASIFGTAIGDVQNAYQGFAKQNYTMLDNLRLGYGGTKTEMERLISDANEYAATIGESSDMTIDSFADVVRAIDLIQRKQGIAGNAGAETLKTISGSLGATKAAWENFLTSLGTGDDMLVQQAIGGLVNTVFGTWSDETRKREGGLINNLSKTLQTIFNSVARYVPQLMSRFAYSIIEGIGNAFGFDTSGIEEKFDRVWDIIDRFKTTVTNGWGTFVGWIQQVWDGFTSKFDSSGFELALANVKQILADVWGFVEEHIIPLAPTVGEFLGYAVSALGKVLAAITELVRFVEPYVAQALLWLGDLTGRFWEFAKAHEDLRDFVKSAWEVIKRVVGEFVEQVKTAIVEKFEAIRTATVEKWQAVKDAIAAKVQAAKDAVVERFNAIRESIHTTVDNIKTSMTEKWNNIKTTITEKVDAAKQAITDKFTAAKEKALGIFDDIKKGIRDKIQWAKEKVSKIIDDIKGLFDFSWSLPAPKLPHITWNWQDVGGIVSIPSFGVDWYGKGGVFDTATLIGIGERGREAALPLNDRTYREIADGISKQAGGSVGVTITGNSFVVREEADIDRIAAELDRRIRRERMAMA